LRFPNATMNPVSAIPFIVGRSLSAKKDWQVR
jgi:hypothetical protein